MQPTTISPSRSYMILSCNQQGYHVQLLTLLEPLENNSQIALNQFFVQGMNTAAGESSCAIAAIPVENWQQFPMPGADGSFVQRCPCCLGTNIERSPLGEAFIELGKFDGKRYEVEGECDAWDCNNCQSSFFVMS